MAKEERLTIDVEVSVSEFLKKDAIPGDLTEVFLDALYLHRKQIMEYFADRAEHEYRAAKATFNELSEKKRLVDICDGIYEKETGVPSS